MGEVITRGGGLGSVGGETDIGGRLKYPEAITAEKVLNFAEDN
jgi:hypothetical protein